MLVKGHAGRLNNLSMREKNAKRDAHYYYVKGQEDKARYHSENELIWKQAQIDYKYINGIA